MFKIMIGGMGNGCVVYVGCWEYIVKIVNFCEVCDSGCG